MPERPALLLVVGAVAVAAVTLALGYVGPSSTSSFGPIVVLQVAVGGPPIPAGPTLYLSVENDGGVPIDSLSARLFLSSPYSIEFSGLSPASPLEPGHGISTSRILEAVAYSCSGVYWLTFQGDYTSGGSFHEGLWVPLSCLFS